MTLPSLEFWSLHLGACLATGALAWGVGLGLHRTLRLSHASRAYWLGVWTLAALPTAAALALRWLGPETSSWPITPALPLPMLSDAGAWSGVAAESPATPTAAAALRDWLEPLLAALYLSGAIVAALRWWAGLRAVRRIVAASRPFYGTLGGALDDSSVAAECRRLGEAGIEVRSIDDATSPFAVCLPRPTILVPAALSAQMSDEQLRMVLGHEAAHLARRDPQRAAGMRLVQVLLWFDPFLRLIAQRVQIAAELRCDAAAIADRADRRRSYAQAYLQTLRLSAGLSLPASAAAFSRKDPGHHRLRIAHMIEGDRRRRVPPALRWLLAATALVAGAAIASVQIAATPATTTQAATIAPTSAAPKPAPGPAAAVATASVEIDFSSPMRKPKISGHFGEIGPPRSNPHRGLDFTAARGTPVHAPAAGVVVAATERYDNAPNYGTVVVLDHGGGWQSLYAHLDAYEVQVGQQVASGERIGRVGTTGKVTGPHVHVEMLHNGQRVDPEPLLR
ncbi:peptidase M48 family protein [Lysobacter antibioticus]|uniref:M23/M56 family metallopeptidase n=1 Tax=Lysobacter antibioticus TaxID=84531 RepID=UPI000716EE98|nr:M23/M56 family metallopeptidase [Lysobacter antibioticus]ALN61950.1 peptidase M48 family protein [Lysobacter antibioticus]